MDYITVIKSLISNSDGLAFIVAILMFIFNCYLFLYERSKEIVKEQHENLISPVFFLLEPYLFQSIDKYTLEETFNLIEQNKYLVDGKLLEITHLYKEDPSKTNYNSLCSYINKAYDKSCKRLGLKPRSIEYRLLRTQYKNKLSLTFYIVIIMLKGLLFFSLSMFIFFSLLGLILYRIGNVESPENKAMFSILFWLLLFSLLNLLRYLESKH